MKKLVSIVIPTFHRKDSLIRLLRKLKNEKGEVIVVEQEENNGAEYKKIRPITYIYLHKRSIPYAMNVGMAKAKRENVLFLDDDVTVSPNLVQNHMKNFSDPRVAATIGRIITDGQQIESDRKDTGSISWIGGFRNGFSSTLRQEVDTVIGANTCWRKDVLKELGGFDKHFTGNALRFESDLSLRAKKAGYKIIFEPNAVVDHHRAETGGARKSEGRLQWYFDFFSNETYFFLKHFNKLLLPLFLFTKIEWALRCMFGFGREVSVRSFVTPFAGVFGGLKKYNKYRADSLLRGNDTGKL